jgi:hypothetical protein
MRIGECVVIPEVIAKSMNGGREVGYVETTVSEDFCALRDRLLGEGIVFGSVGPDPQPRTEPAIRESYNTR